VAVYEVHHLAAPRQKIYDQLAHGGRFLRHVLSSTDAQFLELRKFAVQEVCRLWRVPLHMVGDLDRTTHSNAEELGQQFLSLCLLPILRLWQDSIKITCLTREERKTLYPEFLVDARKIM
jgi:phage portal protein BeeE